MADTAHARMARLARTFPCMAGKPGVGDALPLWDAAAVDAWAASGRPSHGERVTGQFLLAVWDPDGSGRTSGEFELMEALRVWDLKHREAFLRWAADPWWP